MPDQEEASAVRFDALLYGIELAYLMGNKYGKARKDLLKKVRAVAGVANIPQIKAQEKLLNQILHTDYLETAGVDEFEHIRENLRELIKYIPKKKKESGMIPILRMNFWRWNGKSQSWKMMT